MADGGELARLLRHIDELDADIARKDEEIARLTRDFDSAVQRGAQCATARCALEVQLKQAERERDEARELAKAVLTKCSRCDEAEAREAGLRPIVEDVAAADSAYEVWRIPRARAALAVRPEAPRPDLARSQVGRCCGGNDPECTPCSITTPTRPPHDEAERRVVEAVRTAPYTREARQVTLFFGSDPEAEAFVAAVDALAREEAEER